MPVKLRDFILANRGQIIGRAQRRVQGRAALGAAETKLAHGVALLLTQLVDALAPLDAGDSQQVIRDLDKKKITDSAALHGHELLRNGFTVAQVVLGYGDVSQVVTELAAESGVEIRSDAFQLFNRCLDDAIAGAVTASGQQRERDLAYEGTERMGFFAHELRNLLNTATLSFAVLKEGRVGLGGSTGAMHARSLAGLTALVERSLAEVRLAAGAPLLERIALGDFISEISVSAAMHAEGYGVELTVSAVEADLAIEADRQLLGSALSNLLQNAFKFTHPRGRVSLTAYAALGRILIDVCDECGGLPVGKAEDLFRPFTRGGANRTGLGLGLNIAQSAIRANSGDLSVRDVPGKGCVFTISLPRQVGAGPAREAAIPSSVN
jgi:signal transduction histidine kinase